VILSRLNLPAPTAARTAVGTRTLQPCDHVPDREVGLLGGALNAPLLLVLIAGALRPVPSRLVSTAAPHTAPVTEATIERRPTLAYPCASAGVVRTATSKSATNAVKRSCRQRKRAGPPPVAAVATWVEMPASQAAMSTSTRTPGLSTTRPIVRLAACTTLPASACSASV
jgi:hypothetical protein